jgi:16S rRNA (guanine1207-N2)-methyltransferase
MSDSTVDALFWPFLEGQIEWPQGDVLFLRARDGRPLHERKWPGLVCEQTFKPDAAALERAGIEIRAEESNRDRSFPLVMLLPPRQRDEARALLARAIESASMGGRVIACASNNEGARSLEADLRTLAGPLEVASKHKCRVFWTAPLGASVDRALLAEWRALDAVRPIEDGRFVSRPGVFAWDRIDVASALLAAHLPEDLAGRAADLGAGFGYLSVELLRRALGIRSLDLYEAEQRALDLARTNLAPFAATTKLAFYWHDVTTGLRSTYDVIVTNPPFHAQRGIDRPDIGRRFIQVAADALDPGGRLWLVANRHLPYESVLTSAFDRVRVVAAEKGFKVVEGIKAVGGRL